jgi:hypothetical protein
MEDLRIAERPAAESVFDRARHDTTRTIHSWKFWCFDLLLGAAVTVLGSVVSEVAEAFLFVGVVGGVLVFPVS